MPRTTGSLKYLLVFVGIFFGGVEIFPTQREKASAMLRFLLKEVIPRFGLANTIRSDNESAFLCDVVQKVSAALQITWKLHASWRPQSTGKWENMSHTMKKTLVKICQETNLKWDKFVPTSLLCIWVAYKSGLKSSLFQIIYARPLQALQDAFRPWTFRLRKWK